MPRKGKETTRSTPQAPIDDDIEMVDGDIEAEPEPEPAPKPEAPTDAPKTADEAIKGLRLHQAAIQEAAREASAVYADIKEAKGTGMSLNQRRELENEFNTNITKATEALKALNKYKELIEEVAEKDKVAHRAKMADPKRKHEVARLLFPPHDFDRAKHVAALEAGEITRQDFHVAALSALLAATLALAGADAAAANAVKEAFTDPAVTFDGSAYEAAAAVTTKTGVPVFLPGSELEQTHRVVGEELHGDLAAVAAAEAGLAVALAEAAEEDEEERKKREEAAARAKKPRKPRGGAGAGAGGARGGARGGKKKEEPEKKPAEKKEKLKKEKGEEQKKKAPVVGPVVVLGRASGKKKADQEGRFGFT